MKKQNYIGKMVRQKRPKGKNGECRDSAVVRIRVDGKMKSVYLGRWGSKEAEAEYRRLAKEYYSDSKVQTLLKKEPTLFDVYKAFLDELDSKKDESSRNLYKAVIWYGMQVLPNIPCSELEVRHLVTYQDYLVGIANDVHEEIRDENGVLKQRKKGTWSRQYVTKMVKRHKTIIRFGASKGIVPYNFLYALTVVPPIQKQEGLTETKPRQAVADEDVLKTIPFLPEQVGDMVLLILGASLRPIELCRFRLVDLDTSGDCWRGVVKSKTTDRGFIRYIAFSREETNILRKWSAGKQPDEYIFSPPGNNRQWRVNVIGRILRESIKLANKTGMAIQPWTLYQLRHAGYSENAEKFGTEIASKIAGNSPQMARVYDHSQQQIVLQKAVEREAWWQKYDKKKHPPWLFLGGCFS